MAREKQIKEAARQRADQYDHPAKWSDTYYGFIDGAEWADQHPHWIPVEEELPKENGKTGQSISVWATNGLMSCEMRYNFDTKKWTDMWGDPFDVTHWMPLPEAPRKE